MARATRRSRRAPCAVACALAASAGTAQVTQVEQLDKRRLDDAESLALSTYLQPLVASDRLDLGSLQSQAIRYLGRGRAAPQQGWRLLAEVWSQPSVNAEGLCAADEYQFEATATTSRWKPGTPARLHYVWLGAAPACERVAHPVGVDAGVDGVQVAAVLRNADALRQRAAGLFGPRLAREGCGVDLRKLELNWIAHAPLAGPDLDARPSLSLVYVMPDNDFQQIQVTARFGPGGVEPGEAGCQLS